MRSLPIKLAGGFDEVPLRSGPEDEPQRPTTA